MPAPTTFAEAQDVLAARLPGYTRRAHQMALAEAIEQAIAGRKPGLFQAGTGTGKSLALLIPAILSGIRTVVATSTKALQTQYAKSDLPFLEEHLGVPFTYAILKGRSNYPCHARAEEIKAPTARQQGVLDQMEELSTREAVLAGKIIDREDFPALAEDEWKAFSMSAAECPGAKSCPFSAKCFAERAKAKAAEADVVVTNTAYLMMDRQLQLASGGNVALLGEIGQLIVDEAHNLPEAARSALEDTMTEGTFAKMGRDMAGYLNAQGGNESVAEKIGPATDELWAEVTRRYADFTRQNGGKADPMPLTLSMIIEEMAALFIGLYQAIDEAREEIKATPAFEDHEKIVRERILRRSAALLDRLRAYTTDDPDQTIRWVEQETDEFRGQKRTRTFLRSAPVSVAGFLRAAIWDEVPAILSSATLTSGTKLVQGARVPDFDYLAETMGLRAGEALTFDAGSPFNYQRQVKLFVPAKGIPEPAGKETAAWRSYAQSATMELVTQSGGGALLLYTSRSALNEAYQNLSGQLRRAGLTVLKQGDAPTSELVRAFKEDGNAVLFGLKSFFEGVDIPTKALRLVVLDKLPFAVPTDLVYQARCKAIENQYANRWASFDRLTIPSMILVLTQAFGRLIRHRDDLGVVAILDPRLHSKRYGKTILEALPPAARTSDITDAGKFLKSIR
jgi:ATP-dependent DNA helicase DinG